MSEVCLIGQVDIDAVESSLYAVPLFAESVPAGFPSPAQGYEEARLDLNQYCIKHPAATYMVRADGDSMSGIGIYPGDILIVDRSLTAKHQDTVIASVDGSLTVKTLELRPRVRLVPQNRCYAPIEFREGQELQIFGVVTHVVRALKAG